MKLHWRSNKNETTLYLENENGHAVLILDQNNRDGYWDMASNELKDTFYSDVEPVDDDNDLEEVKRVAMKIMMDHCLEVSCNAMKLWQSIKNMEAE